MRRLLGVALVGIAMAGLAEIAEAQGRGAGRGGMRGRPGVADTARLRQLDSLRAARGDTARRRGPGMGPGDFAPGRGGLAGIALTDNERAAVKSISDRYRAEFKQLRDADQQAARERNAGKREQVEAIAQRQQAEIRAALTAEHQAQFDANVEKRQERVGRGGFKGRRPPARR